jgi:hypothetical protein
MTRATQHAWAYSEDDILGASAYVCDKHAEEIRQRPRSEFVTVSITRMRVARKLELECELCNPGSRTVNARRVRDHARRS